MDFLFLSTRFEITGRIDFIEMSLIPKQKLMPTPGSMTSLSSRELDYLLHFTAVFRMNLVVQELFPTTGSSSLLRHRRSPWCRLKSGSDKNELMSVDKIVCKCIQNDATLCVVNC